MECIQQKNIFHEILDFSFFRHWKFKLINLFGGDFELSQNIKIKNQIGNEIDTEIEQNNSNFSIQII